MPALIVILVLSVVLAALLVGVLGWRRPGRAEALPAAVFLLAVLFLGMWAGILWVDPVGPVAWGVPWVPLVIIGVVLSLVLAVTIPSRRPPPGEEVRIVPDKTTPAERTLGMFSWILLAVLLIVVVAGYLRR
jgi:hypothetical protein